MKTTFAALALLTVLPFAPPARGEAVKDREGAIRDDKAAMEKDARWLYNDIDAAFAAAEKSGKPLLVVLRCVPCIACSGIDSQVLLQEKDLDALLDQFVCLRLINANALDLARFQFDYDLSFSVMMFHADGTVLGRYGSWAHQKDAQDKATAGLQAALRGALRLHTAIPGIRANLTGKQGAPMPFQSPVEIPGLAGKYTRNLDWEGKVVQSCVHCHMIGDALRNTLRDKGQPIPDDLIFPQPPPETVGLGLEERAALTIASVTPDTAAARAGFRSGDTLLSLDGQPLISIADVSWALHRAPAAGKLLATVRREGKQQTMTLVLTEGWRRQADITRRVGTWGMRAMATGGLLLESLPEADRAALSLPATTLALRTKHVGQYGKHAAAKNAGWKEGDILVELDGRHEPLTEGQLIGHILRQHPPGTKLKATVLRNGTRIPLILPVQ